MIGDNLKRIRELNKIGLNELSRLSGVSASYISSLERNEKKNPSMHTLEKLASTLGVDVSLILETDSLNNEEDKTQNVTLNNSKSVNYPVDEATQFDRIAFSVRNRADPEQRRLMQIASEHSARRKAMSKMLKKYIFDENPLFLRDLGFDDIELSDAEKSEFCFDVINFMRTASFRYRYRYKNTREGE